MPASADKFKDMAVLKVWSLKDLSTGQVAGRIVFFATILYVLIMSTICIRIAIPLINKPFPGFFINERLVAGHFGQYNWTGVKAGLKNPDKILTANGVSIHSAEDLERVVDSTRVGNPITYTVDRSSGEATLTIPTMRFTAVDLLTTFGVLFSTGFLYVMIGIIVFILKPDIKVSWVFFLSGFLMGISSICTFDIETTHLRLVRIVFAADTFQPALVLHLCLLFPERLRIVEKHPSIQYIPYIMSAITIIPLEWLYPQPAFQPIYKFVLVYLNASVLIFVAVAFRAYVKKSSALARQRAKVVLLGSILALPLPALAPLLATLGSTVGGIKIVTNLSQIPTVIFPASIAYAIAKHNLFDVDVYIKRAVGYGLMTAIVGVTYFSLQMGVRTAFEPVFGEHSEKIYPIIFAVLIVFMFNPLNRMVQTSIDKLFYRKKFDYKETISKVSDALTSVLDINEVVTKIIRAVRKEMFIDRAGVFLLEPAKKECQALFIGDEAQEVRANEEECIKYDDPLFGLLSRDKKMITIYDIEEDPYYRAVKEDCKERFLRLGLSMVLPLVYQDQVKGALALGYKKSGQFYSREDVDLLNTLANNGAVAIENARLVDRIKKEEIMRTNLSRYLSPQIVDHIVKRDVEVNLGGDRKVVTVMFLDIIGFTSLSERLEPEEVVSILNEYFKEMSEGIFKWEGTLDKFVGDEIMAFWGAPIDQPRHAELAVRCAVQISERLDMLRERWKREGRPVIDCGIGINTGEVLVGNIGVEGKKMDYTVIGDSVNLASRVEKLTRHYGSRILITENTFNNIKDYLKPDEISGVKFTDLAEVKVRGKEKGVRIFKVEHSGTG
jgi:class 3 adenylate cyclase